MIIETIPITELLPGDTLVFFGSADQNTNFVLLSGTVYTVIGISTERAGRHGTVHMLAVAPGKVPRLFKSGYSRDSFIRCHEWVKVPR